MIRSRWSRARRCRWREELAVRPSTRRSRGCGCRGADFIGKKRDLGVRPRAHDPDPIHAGQDPLKDALQARADEIVQGDRVDDLDTPPGGDRKRKDEVRATGPPKAMFPEMAKVLSLAWVVGSCNRGCARLENVSGHAMGPIEEACHGAVVGIGPNQARGFGTADVQRTGMASTARGVRRSRSVGIASGEWISF